MTSDHKSLRVGIAGAPRGASFLAGHDLATRVGPVPFHDAARCARERSSAERERRTARRWFRSNGEGTVVGMTISFIRRKTYHGATLMVAILARVIGRLHHRRLAEPYMAHGGRACRLLRRGVESIE